MRQDPVSRLEDYLKDATSLAWSSQGLIDMFADLEGVMKNKQQIVLLIIDEKFSAEDLNCIKT